MPPLICSSYSDFREERALLCAHAYPPIYLLCAERGVAFSPIDPFLQLERPVYGRRHPEWQWTLTEPKHENPAAFMDELAWSRNTLLSFLVDAPHAKGCFFWIGAKYGWMPSGKLAAQARKVCAWVQGFYDDTGFDSASVHEMLLNRFVVEKIDQVVTAMPTIVRPAPCILHPAS